jgi:hypothetical protein
LVSVSAIFPLSRLRVLKTHAQVVISNNKVQVYKSVWAPSCCGIIIILPCYFRSSTYFLVIKTTEKNVDWLIRDVGLDDEYSNVPTLMVAIV